MAELPVGIGDLSVYIPSPQISLESIAERRIAADPEFERRLRRAISVTGQQSIRFPDVWEDNVTLSATGARRLLDRLSAQEIAGIRYLAVGTETAVDHSKPIAAYVEGALERSGLSIPHSLSTFQVQHACAGGTISMLSVSALLRVAARTSERGVVICSDIARYDAPSTAEITQGAGSVSMLIEPNPRLIELDLATQGYSSSDVDDFFRPLGSITAKVKGRYSVECYHTALAEAFADHCQRLGAQPAEELEQTDLFVFHVPFANMAVTAAHSLLSAHLDLSPDGMDNFLRERGFQESLEASKRIGNIYSGSAYLAMAFLLKEREQVFGDDLAGKRILIGSYGSGNTMAVVSGTIAAGGPATIRSWNLDEVWETEQEASFEDYEAWLSRPSDPDSLNAQLKGKPVPQGHFGLQQIREDGYREYAWS